ncbi:MAG: retropepsin-like aspartic protease [Pseudomonadota bacterium]
MTYFWHVKVTATTANQKQIRILFEGDGNEVESASGFAMDCLNQCATEYMEEFPVRETHVPQQKSTDIVPKLAIPHLARGATYMIIMFVLFCNISVSCADDTRLGQGSEINSVLWPEFNNRYVTTGKMNVKAAKSNLIRQIAAFILPFLLVSHFLHSSTIRRCIQKSDYHASLTMKDVISFIPVQISDRTFTALFDTGATNSLISIELTRILGLGIAPSDGKNAQSLTGHSINIVGTTTLKLTLANTTVEMKMYVTNNSPYKLLLGTDFMRELGKIQLDYENGILRAGCTMVPLGQFTGG